ncbi:ABC transporter substrate-binding protein [Acholeplasma vituli]|uniref:ABC transporter substrate-binding protein n=1 Tax=Paracholeplasma vituli TaxID=69473 RepID=A0ABT2PVT7_9MOLU|nr:ABC transporter substrate-binding protein [Paracholeplasma vituli]MCU0105071.1 ABC transporter substrate-binding protein [Paracholeplasma vituli]
MKKLVLVFVMALTLMLAACGSSLPNLDVEELKVPAVPAGLVQGVTATTIKVGNTAPKTGGFAAVGIPFNAAIEAVFAEYNARQDVARKIEFVTYDDGSDASTGLTNTKKLVEEDKVFALVGHVGTGTVNATLPYILEKHIPMVYAATGINQLYFGDTPGNPVMAVQPIYKTDGRIAYARAISESLFGPNGDAKLATDAKVGVLYTNDDAGKSIASGIIEEAKNAKREKNLIVMSFLAETTESVVKSMLAKKPDVIIVAGNQAPFNQALTSLDDLGNTAPVITSYVNTNASTITVKDYGFDIYGSAWIDIVDPQGLYGFSAEYWAFVATMTAAGYGTVGAANNYTANAFAMAGYVAAKVFLAGLDRVGANELTFKSYITAMESAPIDIPMGGQIDFSDGMRWGISSMALSKLAFTAEVKGDNPATEGVVETDFVVSAAKHAFVKIRDIESLEQINAKR